MVRELRSVRATFAFSVLCLMWSGWARATTAQCTQPDQQSEKKQEKKPNKAPEPSASVDSAMQDVPYEGTVTSNQCFLVKRNPPPSCTLMKKYPVGQACKCNIDGKAEEGEVQ